MRWRGGEEGAEEEEDSTTQQQQQQQQQSSSNTGSSSSSTRLEDAEPMEKTDETSSSSSVEEEKKQEIAASSSSSARVIIEEDGADHAEEGIISGTTWWKPQNEQSTCEFTHIIENYAEKRESGCKKAEYSSTTVDEFGNRWRLIVYVNGNGRASNHHLSLFLQVADAEDLPFGWKKAVSYVLTLEHPKGGNYSYAKRNPDKTFKMCPKAIDWGWSQFITSDRIQQEGFVSNDSLTVRASVTVKSSSVSIDEEDSELYLKCAVEEGDVDAVKVCLEHGASVNCQFKDDLYTPLHTACSSGSTSAGSMEVLNLLLEEGADGNACNKWKETPLLIAANNGHHAAVEALLENGANPSLCSEAGWSALTFAAHKGYDDIVALLLKAGSPVNCPVTEDSSTPLHKACAGTKTGHLASVKLLIDGGADVHALNKWRETPLLTAANHGQAGAVEALLEAGADSCKCTDTGWSPLSIAAYKGHDEVVRLLLEEGAPTEEDDPTLSALLQAATKGLPDTVELLLLHGADHTVTTKKGDTALSILVEQNLIDTAVEMVTVYNASIPRCSRDRKKVQRARLLINLRMKQLERECGKNTDDSKDDQSIEDGDDSQTAEHQKGESNEPGTKTKKGKKKKKGESSKVSAEEKARAAEEALLLELEQEETKAKKEQAEADSKRQRKKEKKERERRQKMMEEQARKAKEEEEKRVREQLRKEHEEKQRKECKQQLIEQQERERKEMLERENFLAAKRKEREQKERKERDQRKKNEQAKVATPQPSPSNGIGRRIHALKEKAVSGPSTPRNNSSSPLASKAAVPNRRWETLSKVKSPPESPTPPVRGLPASIPQPSSDQDLSTVDTAPKTMLTPRSNSSWNTDSGSSSSPVQTKTSPGRQYFQVSTPQKGFRPQLQVVSIEHPAIAIYRKEKVAELVSQCLQRLPMVNEPLLKLVLSRWAIRAAHDSSPVLDSIIPSWTESDRQISFFQRQLIAESRKGGVLSTVTDIGTLKEAGASIAAFCQNVASDVDQFRQRIEDHLPKDWTDAALGMTVSDGTINGSGSVVTLSWANRGQVVIPSKTFATLRERHVGPPSRFLASCFMAKSLYDTRRLLTGGTEMDLRLSPKTKGCLTAFVGVSAELWSDPFSADNGSVFWGTIEPADILFGGQRPFGKDPLGGEEVLATHGSSLAVFLPLDATVASKYVQRMLDIVAKAEIASVALSFAVFAHARCFVGLRDDLSHNDLHQLDPRLRGEHQRFLQMTEVLAAGQHSFHCGDGAGESSTCATSSLMFVLQNDAGKARFEISPASARQIIASMSHPGEADDIVTPVGFVHESSAPEVQLPSHSSYFDVGMAPLSPDPQRVVRSEFGTIGGETLPQPFSPASDSMSRGTNRRGRLFDLVDNGEDDADDLVSGMLNNLDADLFQNANVGSDIDIEAISLMGIGGVPPARSLQPRQSHQGRFG